MQNIFIAFVLLVCVTQVFCQTRLFYNGGFLVFNYNASVTDDTTPPGNSQQRYNQLIIPDLDLSIYEEITLEMWIWWNGGGVGSLRNEQNSPLFYHGSGTSGNNSYIWFTPCNGTFDGTFFAENPMSLYRAGTPTKQDVQGFYGFGSERFWIHISLALREGESSIVFATYNNLGAPVDIRTFTPPVSIKPSDLAFGDNLRTTIIGYINDSSLIQDLEIGASYIGKLDELRLWNKFKTPAEIAQLRETSLAGTEPNLVGYWSFDETSGSIAFDYSPSKINGHFGIESPSRFKQHQQASLLFTGIFNLNRNIQFNGSIATEVVARTTISGVRVRKFPATGIICAGGTATVANPCSNPIQGDDTIPVSQRRATFTFVPVRASCGQTETFVTYAIGSTNNFTVNVNVGSVSAQVNGFYSLETTGGELVLAGTGFGLNGPFVQGETVQILRPGRSAIPCSNPVVTASGTEISCTIAPGVGFGDIEVSVCGTTNKFVNSFAFDAPIITKAQGNDFSNLTIEGMNFGPSRVFDDNYDSVFVNGTKCEVKTVTHNVILCQLTTYLNESTYEIELTIGGQTTNFTFDFVICEEPCLNGGKCVGLDTCDCTRTGYEGDVCQFKLECIPACQNGVCVRSTSDSSLACECRDGWIGAACNVPVGTSTSSGTTGNPGSSADNVGNTSEEQFPTMIVAAAGGGVGLLIVCLVVAVIVLWIKKRPPPRGGSNFIPLEKKDFTKIIYGEQLTQNPPKTNADVKELEKMLVEDSLLLANALSSVTQITEADKIAKAMVIVFQDNKKVTHLLRKFIENEVQITDSAGTLFRSNSMVSKMFKFYSRLIGLPYLYMTIGPEISELIEEELGLEVDPEKMEEGTDLDEMRWTLMAQSQKILKSILNTPDTCPPQFRVLFAHIKKCVGERFPGNVNTTIGGFIFLRFFCPAVSSPEAYGILEEPPSASSRRLLILITKVLQNLSNDVEFGSKEPYMTKMNDFIQSNRTKLKEFYDKLVNITNAADAEVDLPKNVKQISLVIIADHLRDNLSKISDPKLKQQLQSLLG